MMETFHLIPIEGKKPKGDPLLWLSIPLIDTCFLMYGQELEAESNVLGLMARTGEP